MFGDEEYWGNSSNDEDTWCDGDLAPVDDDESDDDCLDALDDL